MKQILARIIKAPNHKPTLSVMLPARLLVADLPLVLAVRLLLVEALLLVREALLQTRWAAWVACLQ